MGVLLHPDRPATAESVPIKYFLHEDTQLASDMSRNRTVLLVGGIRGHDLLGPAAILQAARQPLAARVIYVPVANP